MKSAILLFLVAFFISPVFAQHNPDFNGVWCGKGYQVTDGQSWPVQITISEGKYLINYPSLDCSGKLTVVKSSRHQLVLKEDINSSNCFDNGKVILEKKNSNELLFKWYFQDGAPGSFAELIRFD